MEEKICAVLKVRVNQDCMIQRCIDNTKWPKRKENKLGILEIYTYCQKFQQRAWDPGKSPARVTINL